MNITQQEAIQLIIDFLAPLHGFWEDMPIDDPLIEQFISLEYAELDESKGKYEINKKGVGSPTKFGLIPSLIYC